MTSRQTRTPSIPIPRSTSATPGRPFSAIVRPRISGTSVHRADDYRSLSVAGMRPTSSLATPSLIRPTPRPLIHTSGMSNRTSPRSLTVFEPRVIRAETSRGADNACLPSTSTSPSRTRRSTGAELKAPNPQWTSVGRGPITPPPSNTFPRPAYLEHSALRHLLQTDPPPSLPPFRTGGEPVIRPRAPSPQIDSDDESNVSPPRESPPASVFSHYPVLRLPTRWCDKFRHPSLSLSNDGRELTYQGQPGAGDKDPAAARSLQPIPPACGIYYYEAEIVSKGQRGHISIGLASAEVKLTRLPGWEKNSWGYYGDDGSCFAGEKIGTPYGPMFGTGDIIGCGIDFSLNRAFFTKNGTLIGHVFENVGRDVEIYASVGLRHGGEAVRVNFGQDPFKFDIEYHVQQQRNQTWADIQSTPLEKLFAEKNAGVKTGKAQPISEESLKRPIDRLVLSYLSHHGYVKTARAFRVQSEKRGNFGRELQSFSNVTSSAEDHAMDIDDGPQRDSDPGMREGDIELRTRIVNSVIAGDIDTVLAETQAYYPTVLEREEGLMLFKLRCRKFVELVLDAAEMEKRIKPEEQTTDEEERSDRMDVDDGILSSLPFMNTNGYTGSAAIPIRGKRKQAASPARKWSAAALALYENALKKAISYGQALDADYKSDRRPEVQSLFTRTFSTVKCYDPIEAGGDTAEVAGHEARVALGNELNQAILRSQGRPSLPALEQLYRQTSACILQLGLCGVGAAAFADMPKEFLET